MEKVTGIGGVFFKSKKPAELSKWYEKNLGIKIPPATYDDSPWIQDTGETIFAPMEESSPHFKDQANLFINFRVTNLDKIIDQLTNSGIQVLRDSEVYPNGIFASLEDPEENQIQLWEVQNNRK